jgi:hypothetical protein
MFYRVAMWWAVPRSKTTAALVIDDVVTGSFDSRGKEVVNSIPISGPKGSDEVEWIWLKLKKITARN